MLVEKRRVGDILIQKGIITRSQLDEALNLQRQTPAPLGSILSHLGFIDEDGLVSVLAEEFSVQPWNLKMHAPDPAAIARIPADIAKSYRVLPVALRGQTLLVAMSNPEDIEAIDMIQHTTKMMVEPVMAARHRLLQMIDRFYEGPKISDSISMGDERPWGQSSVYARPNLDGDSPVKQVLQEVIEEAVRNQASDIHFEPNDVSIKVKLRIGGLVKHNTDILLTYLDGLTERLMALAGVQAGGENEIVSGLFTFVVEERKVEVRLSISPTPHGNRIVLRLFDSGQRVSNTEELGLSSDSLAVFRHMVRKPYGLVLISGPSGAGKTSTLYAALTELAELGRSVVTCESPVEIPLPGIAQSQTSLGNMGYQVAAMVYQDADVLGIGEITDSKTAHEAVRTAMTGQAVIATIQANDALTTLARMHEFGVDPSQLCAVLSGITSQRLLRTLCPDCKRSLDISQYEKAVFAAYSLKAPLRLYVPRGCKECLMTGYRERFAIHELIPVTSDVAELIGQRANSAKIRQAAAQLGFVTLQRRALESVAFGEASFGDAQRQVAFDVDVRTIRED